MALNMKDPDLVKVAWKDTCNIAGWMDKHELVEELVEDPGRHLCWSVGFLVYEDDDCVILSARAMQNFSMVGLSERIPKGMIYEIEILIPAPVAIDPHDPLDSRTHLGVQDAPEE